MGFGEPLGLTMPSSVLRGLFLFHLLIRSQLSMVPASLLGVGGFSTTWLADPWALPLDRVAWCIRAAIGMGGKEGVMGHSP